MPGGNGEHLAVRLVELIACLRCRFPGFTGFIGCVGFKGFIGFVGFIGCIGLIGFIGLIRFIGFIGFIGFRVRRRRHLCKLQHELGERVLNIRARSLNSKPYKPLKMILHCISLERLRTLTLALLPLETIKVWE